ncbi:MAG: hypothetical protein M1820_003578 [Bogoriella megaspora]|nr:MAG: hypothetical protein M1820_003578 [Bogoriella megaspora]
MINDYQNHRYYKPFLRDEPVVIRSPDAIQELSEASSLSQRAVYADIIGFQYTLNHEEVALDPNEQINLRYRLFARAIRINGVPQIKAIHPWLQHKAEKVLATKLDAQLIDNGWCSVQLAPVMRDLATGMLGGSVLIRIAELPEFSEAATDFYSEILKLMGAFQIAPSFMKKYVYSFVTHDGRATKTLFNYLHQALASKDQSDEVSKDELEQLTMFSNMLKASKESTYWSPSLLIQATLGIWFAASHQPWMNLHFIFLELCARPEYIEVLRAELADAALSEKMDYERLMQLPILDSFIKVSVRLNPLDKIILDVGLRSLVAIRRKALKSYTFAHGGQRLQVGQIACVPAWDIMHDAETYPDPTLFDGHRFARKAKAREEGQENKASGTRFADATKEFPIWGYGSKACPGRWHASFVIKLALVNLIERYEFRLEGEPSTYKWFWETFQMPYESSRILMKRRCELWRRRSLYSFHNCKPIPQYQHADGLRRKLLPKKRADAYTAGQAATFTQSLFKEYGKTWLEPSWNRTTIHTCDPKNIQAVTATAFGEFGIEPLRAGLSAPFIDRGILNTDGICWSHSRALIRPTFSRAQIFDFESYEKHFRQLLAVIPGDGSTIDLQPLLKRLYLDTSTEFFLGESVGSLSKESSFDAQDFLASFDEALKGVGKRQQLGRFRFLHIWDPEWKSAYSKVHAFIDRYVENALRSQQHYHSNSTALRGDEHENRRKIVLLQEMAKETSDKIELRNQILNVFFPARDSTAIAVSNTIYLLARHPRVWEKLRAEVGRLDGANLTFESLKSLAYLRYTVNEGSIVELLKLFLIDLGNSYQASLPHT